MALRRWGAHARRPREKKTVLNEGEGQRKEMGRKKKEGRGRKRQGKTEGKKVRNRLMGGGPGTLASGDAGRRREWKDEQCPETVVRKRRKKANTLPIRGSLNQRSRGLCFLGSERRCGKEPCTDSTLWHSLSHLSFAGRDARRCSSLVSLTRCRRRRRRRCRRRGRQAPVPGWRRRRPPRPARRPGRRSLRFVCFARRLQDPSRGAGHLATGR